MEPAVNPTSETEETQAMEETARIRVTAETAAAPTVETTAAPAVMAAHQATTAEMAAATVAAMAEIT